jgi:ABC-2 type transport system permease protein
MAVYFIVFWFGIQRIERNFREDIRSGNIEMYLLRPISYIWQKVLIQIGEGLIAFLSATILSISISYFFVGLPEVNTGVLIWVLGVLLLFVFSQILACLVYILCGLSGFWLENSEPTYFIVSKFIMVFGGAWVPVAFFPKALQTFAEFSPFGGIMAISFSMYPNFNERFPILLGNVLFWSLISYILVIFVAKRAFHKLSVNG